MNGPFLSRTAKISINKSFLSRTAKLLRIMYFTMVNKSMEEMMIRITSAVSFGEAIRSRRKELHYTQGYLSEFSGLSVSFISDLENGKKTIELEKAIYLANLLGLDLYIEGRGYGA